MYSALIQKLAALICVALLASPAWTQPNPYIQTLPNLPQPVARTQVTSNLAVPPPLPAPAVNPYGYAPAYSPGYYPPYNPYGGYLAGKADVITARANANVTNQQAMLVNQQSGFQSIQYRRALVDEANYERSITPNSEDIRLQKQQDAIRRARKDPPLNEIWSGAALNALFTDIKNAQTYGVRGPEVPVSPDVLKNLNLTGGVTSAGLGILKDGPKLRWPRVFLSPDFNDDRKQIEQDTEQALAQAKMGPVDLQLVGNLRDQVSTLGDKLKQMVQAVPASQYIEGKRFLNELGASYATLKDPNVANYFTGQWEAKGATVHELVKEMIAKGLTFAPAVSGQEPSYTTFYQALLRYDVQMSQTASR